MAGITLAGTQVTLEGRQDETVLATLLRAGYTMRMACRGGGCGVCRVHLDSGETTYNSLIAETALPLSERADGIILACRAVPDGNVVVSVPADGNLRCVMPLITPYALRYTQPSGDGSILRKEGITE